MLYMLIMECQLSVQKMCLKKINLNENRERLLVLQKLLLVTVNGQCSITPITMYDHVNNYKTQ